MYVLYRYVDTNLDKYIDCYPHEASLISLQVDMTPLEIAVYMANVAVVKLLLDDGIDINNTNNVSIIP